MLSGIGITAFYIIATVFFGMERWTFGILPNGINPQAFGTLGMLLNFVVTLAMTPLYPAPSQATQDLVDSIREPEGVGPAVVIESAPER